MGDRRSKIIYHFAKWVAMSSARQGPKVRGQNLYPYIQKINFDKLLQAKNISPEAFAEWHRNQTESLAKKPEVPIGWAAKLINMMTKTRVYIAREGASSLLDLIHPPVDTKLIKGIRKKYPPERNPNLKALYDYTKTISGIDTYEKYCKIIAGLRQVAEIEECSLFEVESLWDPADP